MKKKIMAVLMVMSLVVLSVAGCGKSENANNQGGKLTGTITLAGSTSMRKLCEALSESFMQKNDGVMVSVEYTGSGAGLESLASGSVDIGNASRGLKDAEKSNGYVENIVAID